MRGLSRFLMDLIECPEIIKAICKNIVKFYKERTMLAIEASSNKIDIIRSGGDVGTQAGMLLSPDIWRRHIKLWSEELIKPFFVTLI